VVVLASVRRVAADDPVIGDRWEEIRGDAARHLVADPADSVADDDLAVLPVPRHNQE